MVRTTLAIILIAAATSCSTPRYDSEPVENVAAIDRFVEEAANATEATEAILQRPLDDELRGTTTVGEAVQNLSQRINTPIIFTPASRDTEVTLGQDVRTVKDVLYQIAYTDYNRSDLEVVNLIPAVQPYRSRIHIVYWRPYRGLVYEELLHADIRKRFDRPAYYDWTRATYGPAGEYKPQSAPESEK